MTPQEQITEYQLELFDSLDEFFKMTTGKSAADFAHVDTFGEAIRKNADAIARRIPDSFTWVDKNIRPLYANKGIGVFKELQELGGFKLVLGGSGRFGEAHLDSIQGTLLYADTILVPDPFLPWMEIERNEERFRHANLIQAAFLLLQLKPIVDAGLPFPAIAVFPSWEKLLEEYDPQTFQDQLQLFTDFFTFYVSPDIKSFDDVQKFVIDHPKEFLSEVEEHHLFVAPDGYIGEPISKALPRYQSVITTWRSTEYRQRFEAMTPAQQVFTAITERLGPQYHLIENSEELESHPLLCLDQHAHYYNLIARINSERLVRLDLLDKRMKSVIDALSSNHLKWLSRVPINDLIYLRLNNENSIFRERLRNVAERLHKTSLENIDKTVTEVNHEIDEMVAEHRRQLRKIRLKYTLKYKTTAVLAWAAFGTYLMPSLAPYLGMTAPLAIASKFIFDKAGERSEIRKASKSLIGVLSRSRHVSR